MSNNKNDKCADNTNMLEKAAKAIMQSMVLNGQHYVEKTDHNCIEAPKTTHATDKKTTTLPSH